jgi:hypothetical protein
MPVGTGLAWASKINTCTLAHNTLDLQTQQVLDTPVQHYQHQPSVGMITTA